jgi:cell division inhibitor SulA/protein ImuA
MNTVRNLHHLNAWDMTTRKGASLVTATGIPALDELLPGGGWPKGGLVEIIVPDRCTDASVLVLPALARLGQQGRWIVMVTPPHHARSAVFTAPEINASRLLQMNPHPGRSGLWTVESMLRSGDCSAVLAWPVCETGLMDMRLQKAATAGKALCVLFRYGGLPAYNAGVDIRLKLEMNETGRALYLLNSRGETVSGFVLA